MFKLFNRLPCACAIFLMTMLLVSCGGCGGGTVGSSGGGGGGTVGTTGFLSMGILDAPGDYLNVWVTIKEIHVKQGLDDEESGWITVYTPGTFDLLVLQNGAISELGLVELEAGQYNQIRLILTEDKPDLHPYANYRIYLSQFNHN